MTEQEKLEQEKEEKRKRRRKRIRRIILIIIIIIIILLLLRKCCCKKPEVLVDESKHQSEVIDETKKEVVKDEDSKKESENIDNQDNDKDDANPSKDVKEYYYWVVFYDQYGNELQREALKYGTIPIYKADYPSGFIKWDKLLVSITGNTYIHAVCEEEASPSPTPIINGIFTYRDSATRKVKTQIIPFGETVLLELDGGTIELETEIFVEKYLRVDLRGDGYTPNKAKFIGYEYDGENNKFIAHYGDHIVTFDSLMIGETPKVIYVEEEHPIIEDPDMQDTDEYHLMGWYKDKLFKNGENDIWNFETDEVHRDITLYAKWTIIDINEKLSKVRTLYDIGERYLNQDVIKLDELNNNVSDVIRIGGVDCYVLKIDQANKKAEFITKEIYNQRFDGSKYRYENSELKNYMNNFYNTYFKILDNDNNEETVLFGYNFLNTTVNCYYRDSTNEGLANIQCSTLADQKVFALDSLEAKNNISKFYWNRYTRTFIDNNETTVYAFWTSGGYRKTEGKNPGPRAFRVIVLEGNTACTLNVTTPYEKGNGARPCFWIQLEEPEQEEQGPQRMEAEEQPQQAQEELLEEQSQQVKQEESIQQKEEAEHEEQVQQEDSIQHEEIAQQEESQIEQNTEQ